MGSGRNWKGDLFLGKETMSVNIERGNGVLSRES